MALPNEKLRSTLANEAKFPYELHADPPLAKSIGHEFTGSCIVLEHRDLLAAAVMDIGNDTPDT
jgi:hypothetical protein